MTRLPSMQALRALDAFARHGSVWQAADELHLTRSAVSHQLRQLERDLAFPLLEREGSRVMLTAQGRGYAADVAHALLALAGASARSRAEGVVGGSLTIATTPGFGAAWLAPRIGGFLRRHPAVAVHVIALRRLDDSGQPGVDLSIRFLPLGEPPRRDGMVARVIAPVSFTPLCAPSLVAGQPAGAAAIAALPLLHLNDRRDWARWFELASQPAPRQPGVVFSDINLATSAALAGQGVMLGDRFSCAPLLAARQLVAPCEVQMPSGQGYALLMPAGRTEASPALAAFLRWLDGELADEADAPTVSAPCAAPPSRVTNGAKFVHLGGQADSLAPAMRRPLPLHDPKEEPEWP